MSRLQHTGGENVYVVWTDGKPVTVIRPSKADHGSAKQNGLKPNFQFQYKVPISKYSTLAHVAQKKNIHGKNGQGRTCQPAVISERGTVSVGKGLMQEVRKVDTVTTTSQRTLVRRNSEDSSDESSSSSRRDSIDGYKMGTGEYKTNGAISTGPNQIRIHNHVLNVQQTHVPNIIQPGLPSLTTVEDTHNGNEVLSDDSEVQNERLEKEYNALKTKEQEEQVELRRLRTENRLLRQRIDNLEKETATLADRLIHDQVKNAQQEEEVYALKRDLSVARQHSEDAEKKLAETNAKLLRRSNSTSSTSSAGDGTGESDAEKVAKLTKQLADLRHWENESKACIRQLREKIREMEQENRQLQKDPKDEIAQFQEELIACKLREAEGNLSLKELQQKVIELDRHWQKYTEKQAAQNATPNSKVSKTELKNLQDECMALRIKEAQSVSELKEMKQKVMELETQNHICERHNKRLEEETAKLKEQLDEGDQRDKDLQQHIKELERKIEGSENKHKEEQMMLRIKDAEHSQLIAEMRQRIAELEIENQELVTAGQLQNKEGNESLTAKISELQDQVVQLKMARRLQSLSSMAMSTMSIGDTESDNESDLEATLHKHALKLTDSLSLTTGMTLEDIAQASMALPPGPPPADDSTDSEDIGNGEVIRKKVIQRKKRKNHKDGDFDKTPTQDSVEMPFSLVKNGITNIDLNQTHGDQSKHKGLSSTTSEVESSTTSNAMDCVSSNLSTPSRKGTEHDCVSEPVDL